jgi:hypothetical protein
LTAVNTEIGLLIIVKVTRYYQIAAGAELNRTDRTVPALKNVPIAAIGQTGAGPVDRKVRFAVPVKIE